MVVVDDGDDGVGCDGEVAVVDRGGDVGGDVGGCDEADDEADEPVEGHEQL